MNFRRVLPLVFLLSCWLGPGLAVAAGAPKVDRVVFAVRLGYEDPHWYANIGYYCDNDQHKAYAGNGRPDAGKLVLLDVASGKVALLVDDPGGSVRDPQVHYDAGKILFSYRPSGTDHYHLYEINVDGSGLRQITTGEFDDYEPAYLPDGRVVFVSTRCRCWVNCWMTQVGVLYRCDADGGGLRRISYNAEHDNTPAVLPDGRILYTRWEYVDRSQVEFHHLWTINPDGTGQAVFYGNLHPGTVMIDARPVPGTDQVVACFSPGHGVNNHQGIVTLVSPKSGPDARSSARALHKGSLVKDPYPLSADGFLVARGKQILFMDGGGQTQVLYQWDGEGEVQEPRPVLYRPREKVIPSQTDAGRETGRFVLADVYQGRNLEGVRRGDVKKLLVLEILPKQVNFSGGPDLVSFLGTFTLERVLGTVPVEKDGSAFFEAPACRPLFFVALDDKDLSVKRMHSFTSLMPGQTAGCVGCHEPRTDAPAAIRPGDLAALRRAPRRIEPFAGFPDVLDFQRDIQPILDRHCLECHNPRRRDDGISLAGDLGPSFSQSFFSLFVHRQVADGRNGLGNSPPRTVGSSASALLKKLDESHYKVKVTPQEWRTVWLWIESAAPYAGSYAALRNQHDQELADRATGRVFHENGPMLLRRCGQCHALGQPTNGQGRPLPFQPGSADARGLKRPKGVHERVILENDPLAKFSVNVLLDFTRPELSPILLGPLAHGAGGYESCGVIFKDTRDPDYQALLATISKAKTELDVSPRFGTPGFKPNPQYVREMKRFGILPVSFDPSRDALDVFQTDQAYWRSFWQ
jgi:mono/diheme cytochrome c family protein